MISPCPTSEELNLDDVMDIELDFPTITDSQNSQTSLPIHSLSVEVSGSHLGAAEMLRPTHVLTTDGQVTIVEFV